jgi:hypothetical protein
MARSIVSFASLLLAALVVCTMFGIGLGDNPWDLSPGAYVEQQHHAIQALNVTMPGLGSLTALLTLASAILARQNPRQALLLLAAFGCFVTAGLVTRLLNQPINAIVITWAAAAPPENFTCFAFGGTLTHRRKQYVGTQPRSDPREVERHRLWL